jgi:hypothetical protein
MQVKIVSKYGRGVDTGVARFREDDAELVVEYEDGSEEHYQRGKVVAAVCDGETLTEPEIEASR